MISNYLQKMKKNGKLSYSQLEYSQDIGMEFDIEKCAMLVMKRGKRHLPGEMELQNQDKMKTLGENETYKYLGILKAGTIKQVEMTEKIKKEYLQQNYVWKTLWKE